MNVLVDTPVWSLALRRKPENLSVREQRVVDECAELVREGRALMAGPVRQELLSGVREEAQFERLRRSLAAFPDTALEEDDFVRAARFYNRCRKQGIIGGPIDLLLCAVASRARVAVFSTDRDFAHYGRHLPIQLHEFHT